MIIFSPLSLEIQYAKSLKNNIGCEPPNDACQTPYYIPKKVDCDEDGILDFACTTQDDSQLWLILSSEGCPNYWGENNRVPSECPFIFQGR